MATITRQQIDGLEDTLSGRFSSDSGIETRIRDIETTLRELLELLKKDAPCDHTVEASTYVPRRRFPNRCRFCNEELNT